MVVSVSVFQSKINLGTNGLSQPGWLLGALLYSYSYLIILGMKSKDRDTWKKDLCIPVSSYGLCDHEIRRRGIKFKI